MGQAISGEDALDGADGRQWSDSLVLVLQDLGDGLSTIREPVVIEMEPFHHNDFFNLLKGIEAHRFISRQQKDHVAIKEKQVTMEKCCCAYNRR